MTCLKSVFCNIFTINFQFLHFGMRILPTMMETLRLSVMNSVSFLMEVLSRPGRVTDSCHKKARAAGVQVFRIQ